MIAIKENKEWKFCNSCSQNKGKFYDLLFGKETTPGRAHVVLCKECLDTLRNQLELVKDKVYQEDE